MLRALFAVFFLASPVPLGEIFGDIRLGDTYLANAPVQLTCGTESVKGKTDAEGSFRLTVGGSGRCEITVTHEQKTASLAVVVFDKPARYRLVLELKDGAYVLKRV
jgi:hypothetical protein